MTDPTVQSLAVGPRFDAPLPALQTPPPGLRIPVTQTDLAGMRLKGTPMGEIVADLARFVCDPYGFVMWAFPWGMPNTMLADMKGPEQWQKEQLLRIGKQLVVAAPIRNRKKIVPMNHGSTWKTDATIDQPATLSRQPRGIAIVRFARKAFALVRPQAGAL